MQELRREELKKICLVSNLDVILIDSPENLRYYTGFTGGEAVFLLVCDNENSVLSNIDIYKNNNNVCEINVLSEKGMCIITDSRYYEQVEKECLDIPLIKLSNRTYIEVIRELFDKYSLYKNTQKQSECLHRDAGRQSVMSNDTDIDGGFNIAVEASMNLSRYLKLKDSLTGCELIVSGDLINTPRMVKDETELGLIGRAEAIGDEAFEHILSIIKPGLTEREIALELEYYMKKKGASKLSFDTIVASGPNSSMPHAQVTDRIIEKGDFVTMDFGCVYKGYCSDMTRTVAVGNPTDEMRKVYQTVLDANLKAMDGIRAGVKCSDIDALARDYIKDNGYGGYFGHGLGHSVGLYIHEEPRFSPKCDTIMKENMVITDEPGIYLPGRFGVRIEDLVVVKENGYEVLSHSPKELIIV